LINTLQSRSNLMHDTTAMRATRNETTQAYPLGHSTAELERLERQALFLRELTEPALRRAGLRDGMRVLDIGCGVGDVSLLAGDLVAPAGRVLGIDRSAEAIRTAKRRAAALGRDDVDFTVADLDALDIEGRFDAVIGRLVLIYLPDPAATLRRLRDLLRPGGVMAFQEYSLPIMQSWPDGPLFRRCSGWVLETFRRAGLETQMGGKLHATFLAAGLPAPEIKVLGRIEGGWQSPIYDYMADTLRSLAPAAERLGVATAAEIDADTLAERLRDEATRNDACIMPPPLISAWAHA
jgi:ubiquinone/menaquinone biosynthesis C-methylase UbiE